MVEWLRIQNYKASPSREVGLRDSELEKLEGRKELFILYFIKKNVIRALRTACAHCAIVVKARVSKSKLGQKRHLMWFKVFSKIMTPQNTCQ